MNQWFYCIGGDFGVDKVVEIPSEEVRRIVEKDPPPDEVPIKPIPYDIPPPSDDPCIPTEWYRVHEPATFGRGSLTGYADLITYFFEYGKLLDDIDMMEVLDYFTPRPDHMYAWHRVVEEQDWVKHELSIDGGDYFEVQNQFDVEFWTEDASSATLVSTYTTRRRYKINFTGITFYKDNCGNMVEVRDTISRYVWKYATETETQYWHKREGELDIQIPLSYEFETLPDPEFEPPGIVNIPYVPFGVPVDPPPNMEEYSCGTCWEFEWGKLNQALIRGEDVVPSGLRKQGHCHFTQLKSISDPCIVRTELTHKRPGGLYDHPYYTNQRVYHFDMVCTRVVDCE
jgi:hypothetical protein